MADNLVNFNSSFDQRFTRQTSSDSFEIKVTIELEMILRNFDKVMHQTIAIFQKNSGFLE